MIAEVITKDGTPEYVPSFVAEKIEKYKKPINKAAEDAVAELHKQNIAVSQAVKSIEQLSDEEISITVDELRSANLKSTDQVFDIIKKNITTDLPIEALRAPFNKHAELSTIKGVLAEQNATGQILTPSLLKSVATKILLEKEAQLAQ